MKEFNEAIKTINGEFSEHPWLECLIKTMVIFDITFDSESAIAHIMTEAMSSYEELYADLPEEIIKADTNMFSEMIKDTDMVKEYVKLFNI